MKYLSTNKLEYDKIYPVCTMLNQPRFIIQFQALNQRCVYSGLLQQEHPCNRLDFCHNNLCSDPLARQVH